MKITRVYPRPELENLLSELKEDLGFIELYYNWNTNVDNLALSIEDAEYYLEYGSLSKATYHVIQGFKFVDLITA